MCVQIRDGYFYPDIWKLKPAMRSTVPARKTNGKTHKHQLSWIALLRGAGEVVLRQGSALPHVELHTTPQMGRSAHLVKKYMYLALLMPLPDNRTRLLFSNEEYIGCRGRTASSVGVRSHMQEECPHCKQQTAVQPILHQPPPLHYSAVISTVHVLTNADNKHRQAEVKLRGSGSAGGD